MFNLKNTNSLLQGKYCRELTTGASATLRLRKHFASDPVPGDSAQEITSCFWAKLDVFIETLTP
jgi:hypothetical protein